MSDPWDARMDSYIEEAERQITRLRAENEQLRHQLGELADGDAVRDAAWHYDREERDALKAENERLRAFAGACIAKPDDVSEAWSLAVVMKRHGLLDEHGRPTALLDGRGREGA